MSTPTNSNGKPSQNGENRPNGKNTSNGTISSLQQEALLKKERQFKLTDLSLRNPISVLVMIIILVVTGIRSYNSIPKESSPDINVPNILVITTYPGVAPEDMENLVTSVIEDELSGISDVKTMTSTSSEGYSSINMEFESDINIDEALQKVREKVDLAKAELPSDVNEPVIQEINISEFPIMQVNISGRYGLDELKKLAEDLQDQFESLPQVLEVDLAGGLENEVKVDVDLARLKYYNISFDDITKAIANENLTIPGGTVDVGSKQFLVRVPGEYEDPIEIQDIVVKTFGGRPVYIRDVAEVRFAPKDRESYAYLDRDPVITLSVKKRSGQNIIETSEAIKSILEEQSPTFPPTTTYKITSDQSEEINKMVSSLENNILSGLFLVIGVLLFFMGVRNSSFVGISIPMSMFIAFIVLQAVGFTMNMIVLFSLILALGMLVDNAIVVVENIYRYLEEGYTNFEAAKRGTAEVAIPIISGTTTTLAAFLPLAFWPGTVGEFMSFLPKTLIITLSASLFVALVINPVLCSLFMRLENHDQSEKKPTLSKKGKQVLYGAGALFLLSGLFSNPVTWVMLLVSGTLLMASNRYILKPLATWWQERGLISLLNAYESSLIWSLQNKIKVVAMAVFTLMLSFVVFGLFNRGVEFFPEDIPPAILYAQVSTPAGTNVETTRELIEIIEKRTADLPQIGDVETVLSTAGAPISSGMEGSGQTQNKGTVVLNFVDYQEREGSTIAALDRMREVLPAGIAGAEVVIEKQQDGPPTGKPINLELSGRDMNELTRISDEVLEIIRNAPVYSKLEGLDTDLPEPRPEVTIEVDRQKAAIFGLNTRDIGNTVRSAINGVEASKYRDGNDEYDVTVRLIEASRNDLSSINNLTILTESGRQIPISEVATIRSQEGFGGINRKDQKRIVTVQSNVSPIYNSNAVLEEVKVVVEEYLATLPAGYTASWTGQQEDQEEAIAFLSNAFLIAIFLIAFILISQFNSVVKPFIVLTSVIMSISGVLYGLALFQMPFVIIMTGIGIISLAGVVVNNAIVLIDYIDILRERDGVPLYDALVQAGRTRFRPVILTAITTTLGLVPLAIGFNIDFYSFVNHPVEFFSNIGYYVYWGGEQAAWWSPMAIAVIVGLIFATVLTLILVPVMYYLLERIRIRSAAFFLHQEHDGDSFELKRDDTRPESGRKKEEVNRAMETAVLTES